jgi:RNA polymerase sigma-70 factor (ECF subfamily)
LSGQDQLLGKSPEALLVSLARKGDRDAFAELVRRREAWVRTLLLRCCNDATLADDLAQVAFLQAWKTIGQLRRVTRFGPWLKRIAVNTWLQHIRRNDPLRHADEETDVADTAADATGIGMDLDEALASLKDHVRLCIVLSYHEGMTHGEISDFTGLPTGTVKSHIRRGTKRLQELLAAYSEAPREEHST